MNCLNDAVQQQTTFDKQISGTGNTSPQTVAATASIIGGLYNQYLSQQHHNVSTLLRL